VSDRLVFSGFGVARQDLLALCGGIESITRFEPCAKEV